MLVHRIIELDMEAGDGLKKSVKKMYMCVDRGAVCFIAYSLSTSTFKVINSSLYSTSNLLALFIRDIIQSTQPNV